MIASEDLTELATEYRDTLLRDLGVTGIEHATKGRDFDTVLRKRYPVERAASSTGSFNGVGNSRFLYDITGRDDGGESVSGHPDSRYATVRETTGFAAIQSSATLTLCWTDLPSPREVLVAEYLEALDERDLRPETEAVEDENVAERLIDILFDSRLDHRNELPFPWLDLADVAIDNTAAIEHHVAGTVTTIDGRDLPRIETIRFESDHGRDAEDGPFSRWAVGIGINATLAVESYSTGWGKRHARVFVQTFEEFGDSDGDWPEDEWHTAESLSTDGWGFVDGEVDATMFDRSEGEDEDESADISTHVVCIPECRHPSDVLDSDDFGVDFSHATPETPLAGPCEGEHQ